MYEGAVVAILRSISVGTDGMLKEPTGRHVLSYDTV